ncbi:MAG: hypothetical protein ACE5EF_03175 [Dehalococcoidia bacterium]
MLHHDLRTRAVTLRAVRFRGLSFASGCPAAVAIALLVATIAACGGREETPLGSPTSRPPENATADVAATAGPTAAACLPIPQPYLAPSPDAVVEGTVGSELVIDAADLLGLGATLSYEWRQVRAGDESLEYLTRRPVSMSGSANRAVTVVARWPGVYGLEVTAHERSGDVTVRRVDVRVPPSPGWDLELRGAIFGDVFGRLGAAEFDLNPDSPECRDRVLHAAMDGPARAGLDAVVFVPASFYSTVRPQAAFTVWRDLSLEDDQFYAALVRAAHDAGLITVQIEQDAPPPDFTPAQHAELEAAKQDGAWRVAWFAAYREWMAARAARADAYGIDVFVPYLLVDFTFLPDVYPDYERRWSEILQDIRRVFSGRIGMSFSVLAEPVSFSDDFDVVLLSLDGGQYTFSPLMADATDPTHEEIRAITHELLDVNLRGADPSKPIWVIFQVGSVDGQGGVEDPDIRETQAIDFQEQALYYEAILESLREDPRVAGVLTERWDWFDQFDRGGGSLEARFFDQTRESSPRSKPAEQVLGLWFGDPSPGE